MNHGLRKSFADSDIGVSFHKPRQSMGDIIDNVDTEDLAEIDADAIL